MYYGKDPESNIAFYERSIIGKRHCLPRVDGYKLAPGNVSILQFLDHHKKFYTGDSLNIWRYYFRTQSQAIFADREWCQHWNNSSQNIDVL